MAFEGLQDFIDIVNSGLVEGPPVRFLGSASKKTSAHPERRERIVQPESKDALGQPSRFLYNRVLVPTPGVERDFPGRQEPFPDDAKEALDEGEKRRFESLERVRV